MELICKANRFDICSKDKTIEQQLLTCQNCEHYTGEYLLVKRLDYKLYERERDDKQSIRFRRGDAWKRYLDAIGLLDYIKKTNKGYYQDIKLEYNEIKKFERNEF